MTRRLVLVTLAGLAAATLAGCASPPATHAESVAKRREIDAAADAAVAKLYTQVPSAVGVANTAFGMLVFPAVKAGGLVFGGEYGEGVLRVGGRSVDYYQTSAASFGLTAGAQSKAVVFLFMTQAALDKFRASSGWTAGVDASVALVKVGAGAQIDNATIRSPVVAFVSTNAGLMVDVALEGTKVTRLNLVP